MEGDTPAPAPKPIKKGPRLARSSGGRRFQGRDKMLRELTSAASVSQEEASRSFRYPGGTKVAQAKVRLLSLLRRAS